VAFRDRAHATVLFLPTAVTAGLRAEHARLEVFDRGGGAREAYVYPRGGPYRVSTDSSVRQSATVRCMPSRRREAT
jgi:hypothetical protein